MNSLTVITIQSKVFKYLGLMPSTQSKPLYNLWTIIVFFFAGVGLVMTQVISLLFARSLNDFVEQLVLFCTTSASTVKLAVFLSNRKHLIKVFGIIQEADKNLKTGQDIAIMKGIYKRCNQITLIYLVIYLGSLFSIYSELPFLAKENLTWKSTMRLPNEFAHDPKIYYAVLIFQMIGNSLNCILACCVDTYGFLFSFVLSGHIEVLRSHFQNLNSKSVKLHLFHCLKYYEQLDNLSIGLNGILSINYFIQVSTSTLIICACTYQLTQAKHLFLIQLIFIIEYTFAMVVQIFTPNFVGSHVMETSALLPTSAFHSDWYQWEFSNKTAILIFMAKTSRPFFLDAGVFFKLSLRMFILIIRTAYSLFAVLRSTQL